MARRETAAPPAIDGFSPVKLIGVGGYAEVFLYQQHRPSRPVAIKVLVTDVAGMQNAALGIFIASGVLGAASLAVPSVVYALLMNVGAFALIYFARRWLAAEPMRPEPAAT